MLRDSVEVFTKELPIIRKIFKKNGIKEVVSPLYDTEDVDHCMNQFFPVDYERDYKLNSKMSFSFHDSCHILGSASVKINVTENNIKHRVFYTSDLGHNKSLLCEEPTIPQDIDYLIIESTYGNKKRFEEDVYNKTIEYVNDAFKRGGRVIIPAFSVARMQTMILILHKLHILGLIPDITIYVDSPLGVKVTKLYEKYESTIKQETLKFFKDLNINPFNDTMIQYVTSMEDSKLLAESGEPCVIISASGMCEGGHVREHLKFTVEDQKSTVLFVGYNAIETLGSRLQYNNGAVTIDGESYRVRCKIETISGLSAHADLDYLLGYIENVVASNAIKKIFLVHGEPDSVKNVQRLLKQKGITNVVIPELGEQYKL
jgi:metallo-beta-lactamase family protein